MVYHTENTNVGKLKINAKSEDVPNLFGGHVTTDQRKPRGYDEYTKKLDNNYLQIGLRK